MARYNAPSPPVPAPEWPDQAIEQTSADAKTTVGIDSASRIARRWHRTKSANALASRAIDTCPNWVAVRTFQTVPSTMRSKTVPSPTVAATASNHPAPENMEISKLAVSSILNCRSSAACGPVEVGVFTAPKAGVETSQRNRIIPLAAIAAATLIVLKANRTIPKAIFAIPCGGGAIGYLLTVKLKLPWVL